MPYKCCVGYCKSNYASADSTDHVKMFSFPKDPIKLQLWLEALPNRIEKPTPYMRICCLHWPTGVATEKPFRSRTEVSNLFTLQQLNSLSDCFTCNGSNCFFFFNSLFSLKGQQ